METHDYGYIWRDYCTGETHYARDIYELEEQLRASFACGEEVEASDEEEPKCVTVGDLIGEYVSCIERGEYTEIDDYLNVAVRCAGESDYEELRATGSVTWPR